MRELTKSMLRFSWALPVFGVKQMINLSMPTEANQASAAQGFEAVTAAAESEIGEALSGIYSAGDKLGRTTVDMTFKLLMLDTFNPASWASGCGCQETPSLATPPSATPPSATPPSATPPSATPPSAAAGGGWGPIPS